MTKTTQRNKTFSVGTMALVVAVVLFSNGQQQVSADNTISWLPRISSLQLLPVSSFYYQSPSTQELKGGQNCLSPAPTVYYESKAPESPLSSVFGSTFNQFTTIQSGPAASPELDLNKSPVDSSEGGKEDTTDPLFVGDDKNDPQFTAFSFPGGGDGRKALGHQRSLVPVDYFSGKTDPDIINLCSSERSPLINFPPPDSSDASSLSFVALSLVASFFFLLF